MRKEKYTMSMVILLIFLSFTANAVTQANAGNDTTVCADTLQLYANAPASGETGTWSTSFGSPVTFSDIHDPNAIAYNLEGGGTVNTLTWTLDDGSMIGGTSSDDVNITCNYTAPDAGSDDNVCGDTYTLSGNDPSPNTGTWSVLTGSGSFDDATAYDATISGLANGDNTLLWTIHECDGTDVSDTVVITNNLVVANAGTDQTICTSDVVLNANTPSAGQGTWSAPGFSGITFDDANDPNTTAHNLPHGHTTLTWEIDNNGCTNSDDVDINNDSATPSNAGNDQTICSDQTTLHANNPTYGTGQWSVVSGTATFWDNTSRNTNASNLSFGLNRLVWTISTTNCQSSDTVDITNNLIVAYAGEDIASCYDTVKLDANDPSPGSGQWSTSTLVTFDNDTLYNTVARNLSTSGSKLFWEITYKGCTSKDSVIVRKKNGTPVANAGNDQVLCADNTSLTATLNSGETGYWETVSGFGIYQNIDNPTSNITDLHQGANVLRWTVENNGCYDSDDVIITNNLPDAPDAGNDQTLCSDSTALQGNTLNIGTTQWSVSSGDVTFADASNPTTAITAIQQGQNILIYTASNAGCNLTDTVIITNDLPDAPNAGIDSAICADNYILSANNPIIGNGEWSVVNGNGIFANVNSNISNVNSLLQGDNTLRWTITNANCSLSDDVVITNNLPDVPNAGADFGTCSNSAQLNAVVPTIGSGLWTANDTNISFVDLSVNNTIVNNLPQGVDTLIWTLTNANCSLPDTVLVSSSQLTISHTNTNLSCFESNDGSIDIMVDGGFSNYNFNWLNNNGTLDYNTEDIVNIPADTFYVVATDTNNCSISDTIIVTQPTKILANAVVKDVLCHDDSTGSIQVYPSGGAGGYNYAWTVSDSSHYNVTDSTDAHLFNLIGGDYTLVITDSTNCNISETYTINQPTQITLSADIIDNVCYDGYNGAIDLTVDGGTPAYTGYTYQWTEQNDSIIHNYPSGDFSSTDEDIDSLHAGTFSVVVTDLNNCTATATYKVEEPFKGMKLTADVYDVSCKDQHDGVIDLIVNNGTPPYAYAWSDDETTQDLENLGGGDYIITVTDIYNCTVTDTFTVKVTDIECIHVYNVFTPNGDGVNDTWDIDNIFLYPDVEINVFNQWGNKVFSSTGYAEPWDGTYNGKQLPAATYYYTLDLKNGDAPHSGSVTIMK